MRKLVRLACLTLTALIIGGTQVNLASAAQIPGAITSISTTTTKVAQGDIATFQCAWRVPDHSQPGDTFTLTLPPVLAWVGALDFPLKSPSGAVVATGHVDAGGNVVFTLTSFVTTHPINVHGTCTFSTEYTASQTAPGKTELTFTVGSEVIRVPIVLTGPCPPNCSTPPPTPKKDMWWTTNAQNRLQSVFRAMASTQKSNAITVTDTPGAGMALDCTSVKAFAGTTLNGPYLTAPYDHYTAVIACSPGSLIVRWTGLPPHERVEVWVAATITNPSLTKYTNSGSVRINGVTAPVSSTQYRKDAFGNGNGASKSPTPSPKPTPSARPTASSSSPEVVIEASETTQAAIPSQVQPVAPAPASQQLARTGSSNGRLAVAGVLAVLVGAALVGCASRMKTPRRH